MPQHMHPSAYHLRQSDIRKLILSAGSFRDRILIKSLGWLGRRRHDLVALDIRDQSYQTTTDMYGTISIDEMQDIAEQKLAQSQ